MNPQRAFTLIELIVVIAILVALMSMMMVVYGTIRQSMLARSTDNTLRKADACLRLFRNEWGVYPHQADYPEPVDGAAFPNQLFYRLGTDISFSGAPSDAARVKADAATAASKFNDAAPTAVTYRTADVSSAGSYAVMYAGRLNACARERVRLAVIAGNLDLRGPLITDVAGAVVTDRRSSPVLSAAEKTSLARPGWACDYLRGDIERKHVSGDALLDGWRRPLVYVNQVVPGIKMSVVGWPDNQIAYNNVRFGLGVQGFAPTAGPAPGIVAAGRGQLLYGGRIRLSAANAGDGRPTPADATFFPDSANLMHADLRYYAAPGFQEEFELWSAGRDGRFDYMRDAAGNRDNRAAGAYDRELR